jgi:hypothetical protein
MVKLDAARMHGADERRIAHTLARADARVGTPVEQSDGLCQTKCTTW